MQKLPKAPLQEVIFEAMWQMAYDPNGAPYDPKFDLAQGVFAKRIEDRFPIRKRTLPEGAPIKIYPKAIHQFWKDEGIWPVVQLGPGLLVINDTEKNYIWDENFFPMIRYGLDNLEDSYEDKLEYINISLRYIDAVEVQLSSQSIAELINQYFNINLNNNYEIDGVASNINITQTFQLEDSSRLGINISDGTNKFNKPAIIWQTYIYNNQRKNKEEVLAWCEKAHSICSEMFKKMLNPKFYESFK